MKHEYVMYNGNHEVVGMAFVVDGKPAFVTRLFVLEKFRGQGHGRALLRLVCRDATRERKALLLSVEPDPGMDAHRLMNLYEEFDFFSLGDGVTMKRDISEDNK